MEQIEGCDIFYKNKNLLVVSHSYIDVVKDFTETIAPHFNQILALVRFNSFISLGNMLHIKSVSNYSNKLLSLSNLPSNIDVKVTSFYYLPFDSDYKRVGKRHVESVNKVLDKSNFKMDLIHTHFVWSSGYVGSYLKKKYNKPLVITAHGYDIYDLPFRDSDWRNKIEAVLNSADHIITVSEKNHECIKKLNVSTPVTVLPNGYRNTLFKYRDKTECRKMLELPLDKRVIVTVGNLTQVKGHIYLIEALLKLSKIRKDFICYIIGEGELKQDLISMVKKLDLDSFVKILGGKKHEEIPFWLSSGDVFVLSSLNEGNPTVMFESLAVGLPFVGTRVGGIPEIIKSRDYGLIAEPKDSEDLFNKLQQALEQDFDVYKILEYSENFTWDAISQKVLKIYQNLL